MKFFRFLFSGTFMGILLVVFAITIGYATFIENDFDSTTAKMLIYNARWFEMLMLIMIVNFTGMIFTRQLYRKSKLNILVIHIALITIIIGAAITRYIGFEGQMHIREGQTTNRYRSVDTYFNIHIDDGTVEKSINERIWLSPVQKKLFAKEVIFKNLKFNVSMDKYLPNAVETLIQTADGQPIISLATIGSSGRADGALKFGEIINLNGMIISFGDSTSKADIQFIIEDSNLCMRMRHNHEHEEEMNSHEEPKFEVVQPKQILHLGKTNMMIMDFSESAKLSYIPEQNQNQPGKSVGHIIINGKEHYIKYGEWTQFQMNGVTVSMKFGNQTWILPFSLKLNDFQLERYPGSMSPSSFASEITLIDEKNNVNEPYRIFMNNILNYNGYRFYQSSYDKDEKGTVLSVNHDFYGTLVTYIGYFLLFGSMIVSLFTKKTRFSRVSQQIREIHEKRRNLVVGIIAIALVFSGSLDTIAQDQNKLSKEQAREFGKLLVQNKDGRISPINTISNQALVKISKKTSFEGLSADQVFLGMVSNPGHWQNKRIIKVGNPTVQKMLGISGEYANYSNFFNGNGQYILKAQIDEAYAKKPAMRNMFDKELIYVDERVNVCFMVYNGSLLKILPIPGDPNNTWVSPNDDNHSGNEENPVAGNQLFADYISKLFEGIKANNYDQANEALLRIKEYQIAEGSAIIPPLAKTNLEVLYNEINIFKRLFPVFFILGFALFGFLFTQIFKPKFDFKWIIRILVGLCAVAFAAQTLGLGVRWYISSHAPWSNGYESMIYVGWGTMLAGFVFMRKAPIVISVAALLTAVILLTAHMSWLNPEITNLVPVLKSYWLTFHVATITASYSFLALGCLIGFLNLLIIIFRNQKNIDRINLTLRELSLIIELSLSIGLILLVIGNFLGGIWANESWGRYWGWDPKETWSLVTIIVYSFILHMRLIPGLRNIFSFNFLAMFGFASVLMTYFGVNYYLSGLHSYASGDPVPVPTFVYYTVGILILVSIPAFINEQRFNGKSENFIT